MAKNITYGYFERKRPDAVVPAFTGEPPAIDVSFSGAALAIIRQ